MLDQSSDGVCSQPTDDHREHVDSSHEGRIVEDGLEVESDPEREDREANEPERNDHEQLNDISDVVG